MTFISETIGAIVSTPSLCSLAEMLKHATQIDWDERFVTFYVDQYLAVDLPAAASPNGFA